MIKKKSKLCSDWESQYTNETLIPVIKPCAVIPSKDDKYISFEKARAMYNKNPAEDYSSYWIHFYHFDNKIECIWNNPQDYIQMFLKFKGLIELDFSMYRDWPVEKQRYNLFRIRTLTVFFQSYGIDVICNATFGSIETWDYCFNTCPKANVGAFGIHGCFEIDEDKILTIKALRTYIDCCHPKVLISHGEIPEWFQIAYTEITFISFLPDIALAHKEESLTDQLTLFDNLI